jgi:hypothetical protein
VRNILPKVKTKKQNISRYENKNLASFKVHFHEIGVPILSTTCLCEHMVGRGIADAWAK